MTATVTSEVPLLDVVADVRIVEERRPPLLVDGAVVGVIEVTDTHPEQLVMAVTGQRAEAVVDLQEPAIGADLDAADREVLEEAAERESRRTDLCHRSMGPHGWDGAGQPRPDGLSGQSYSAT